MPLVRISLREGTTPEYRKAIAEGVHQAMVEAMAVPAKDRFQVISEYKAGDLIYDEDYLDVKRSDKIVFVQITLSTGSQLGELVVWKGRSAISKRLVRRKLRGRRVSRPPLQIRVTAANRLQDQIWAKFRSGPCHRQRGVRRR